MALVLAATAAPGCKDEPAPAPQAAKTARYAPARSADWVASLPDSDRKRRVILGCTACHQIGTHMTQRETPQQWSEVVRRMHLNNAELGFAVLPEREGLAEWLGEHARRPDRGTAVPLAPAKALEIPAGPGVGFYQDVGWSAGHAWIVDHWSHTLFGVRSGRDPELLELPLPGDAKAGGARGPQQLVTDAAGRVWIASSAGNRVAVYDPAKDSWRVHPIADEAAGHLEGFAIDARGRLATDAEGAAWLTWLDRERLTRLDPSSGEVRHVATPATKGVAAERVQLRDAVLVDGRTLVYTELIGGRVGLFDIATGKAEELEWPEKLGGPGRPALGPDGRVWIPERTTARVRLFDPARRRLVATVQLPIPGDYPFAVRRGPDDSMWVTGSGADALYRVDPETHAVRVYRLLREGAHVRDVAFDDRGGVWTVYASYPNLYTRMPHQSGVVVRIVPR